MPNGQTGLFNRTSAANPFSEYTVVQILYCSGDVHVGNTTRAYTDKSGGPVVQVGALNVEAVVDWIAREQAAGAFAEDMTLMLAGCSAGSLGTQLWSTSVLSRLAYSRAGLLADSFVGVFPGGTEGPLIRAFGFCEFAEWNGVTPASLVEKCRAGELTAADVISSYQSASSPDVLWAYLQVRIPRTPRSVVSPPLLGGATLTGRSSCRGVARSLSRKRTMSRSPSTTSSASRRCSPARPSGAPSSPRRTSSGTATRS